MQKDSSHQQCLHQLWILTFNNLLKQIIKNLQKQHEISYSLYSFSVKIT